MNVFELILLLLKTSSAMNETNNSTINQTIITTTITTKSNDGPVIKPILVFGYLLIIIFVAISITYIIYLICKWGQLFFIED